MKVIWDEYYFPNEVMEQADVIENCMKQLEENIVQIAKKGKDVERIYIVGSGDCYFIGFSAAQAFRKYADIEAISYEAYDFYLLQPKVDSKTLVILFSRCYKSWRQSPRVREQHTSCYFCDGRFQVVSNENKY